MLVVDDEAQLRRALVTALARAGHDAECVADGESALERLAVGSFDLVVLDLNLPGIGGSEVLARLRSFSPVGVIVLSARQAQADKVSLLALGADDYVEKPFTVEEFGARVDAVLRRTRSDDPVSAVLSLDGLEIDFVRSLVVLNGAPVRLTKTEYRLLEVLATHPRRLLTHEWLLRTVWGPGYGRETVYLRTFVAQIRRKLDDDASDPRWIETVPRVGYRWLVEPPDGSDAPP